MKHKDVSRLKAMLGRWFAILVCCIALLMPCRLRMIFSEVLGWALQFLYFSYFGIFNYILKELQEEEQEKEDAKKG